MGNKSLLTLYFLINLGLTLFIMPKFITALKNHNINQNVSEYALEEYKKKAKTPIMGGLMFVAIPVVVFTIASIIYGISKETVMILLSYILFCSVGFADDYTIIIKGNNDGLSPKFKLCLEFIFVIILHIIFKDVIPSGITIPVINKFIPINTVIFLVFMILLYGFESNAVNFTDGMDGLCAGVSFIALIAYVVISYVNGYTEIAFLLMCIMGSMIGYLFFNFHPAKIFMGDSGSLALGALFASISIIESNELLLLIIGGVFVVEMMCVVIQQVSVRLFHKRVFSYTPIHYAFVLKGQNEVTVVLRFYLVQIVLTVLALIIAL